MVSEKCLFTILITTKNRVYDLGITLSHCQAMLSNGTLTCVVYDDGSTDGAFEYVKNNFPKVIVYRNEISKGYLYCRNKMLNETKAAYAISLDDDAHFITQNPLQIISAYFDANPACGLLAFCIFWGFEAPITTSTNEKDQVVQSFVGCGHVWRMEAWRSIANYPEWFEFYGEEDFASYELFKKNWSVDYVPQVLVQHRVNVKARRNNFDHNLRLRRSLRSRWYLLFLFTPLHLVPRKFSYSIWMQLKRKVFKGELNVLLVLLLAFKDLIANFPKLFKQSKRLSFKEWEMYSKLSPTKIYWQPSHEKIADDKL
jgi:glycosyltransferase involved in cell wall biosynthesis